MDTPKNLVTVVQALDLLLSSIRPISDKELVPTLSACGRVLAESLTSTVDLPPMDNAQMDGYALCVDDCRNEITELRVTQRITAGITSTALASGSAARIFTGAMMPAGANAVVMQERCEVKKNAHGEDVVRIKHLPKPGDWVRRIGDEVKKNSVILTKGMRLRSQELGLAASVGIASLPVVRMPRVALFTTGNELTMPGVPLPPGAIYNSNRYLLHSLLESLGCRVSDCGNLPDDYVTTRRQLSRAANEHDLILTSGGMSVGEEDHVRPAIEAEGRLDVWRISMKPGKPLAFGHVARKCTPESKAFFIGMPGNPVSTFITFLLFVRPFILRLQGVHDVAPKTFQMRADFSWLNPATRQEFLRAKLNLQGGLDLFPNQGSSVLTSVVWGDGIISNPPQHSIMSGDYVQFIPFSELLH